MFGDDGKIVAGLPQLVEVPREILTVLTNGLRVFKPPVKPISIPPMMPYILWRQTASAVFRTTRI